MENDCIEEEYIAISLQTLLSSVYGFVPLDSIRFEIGLQQALKGDPTSKLY